MPLSIAKINYVEIFSASSFVSPDFPVSRTSLDTSSQSSWLGPSESPNPLAETFLADESIMEVMSLEEPPWKNSHHRSSFLPSLVVKYTHLEEFSSQFSSKYGRKEIWLTLPKRCQLIFLSSLVSLKISILG